MKKIIIEIEVEEDKYAFNQNLSEKPCPEKCPFYMAHCNEKVHCIDYLMATSKIVNWEIKN